MPSSIRLKNEEKPKDWSNELDVGFNEGRRPSGISITSLSASKPVARRFDPREEMPFEDLEQLVNEEYHLQQQGNNAMERFLNILQIPNEHWSPILTDKKSVVYTLKKPPTTFNALLKNKYPIYKGFTVIEGVTPRQVLTLLQHRDIWDDWLEDYHILQALATGDQRICYGVYKPKQKNRLFRKLKITDAVLIDKTIVSRRVIIPDDDPCKKVKYLEQVSDSSIFYCQSSVKTMNVPPHAKRQRLDISVSGYKLDIVKLKTGGIGTAVSYFLEIRSIGDSTPNSAIKFYTSRRCLCLTALKNHLDENGLKYLPKCIKMNLTSNRKMIEFQSRIAQRYMEHGKQFEENLIQHNKLLNSLGIEESITLNNKRIALKPDVSLGSLANQAWSSNESSIENNNINDPSWKYPSDAISNDENNISGISNNSNVENEDNNKIEEIKEDDDSVHMSEMSWEPQLNSDINNNNDNIPSKDCTFSNSIDLQKRKSDQLLINKISSIVDISEENINEDDVSKAIEEESKNGIVFYNNDDNHDTNNDNNNYNNSSNDNLDINQISSNVLSIIDDSNINIINNNNSNNNEKDILLDTSLIPMSTNEISSTDFKESYMLNYDNIKDNKDNNKDNNFSRKYTTLKLVRKRTTNTPKLDTIFKPIINEDEKNNYNNGPLSAPLLNNNEERDIKNIYDKIDEVEVEVEEDIKIRNIKIDIPYTRNKSNINIDEKDNILSPIQEYNEYLESPVIFISPNQQYDNDINYIKIKPNKNKNKNRLRSITNSSSNSSNSLNSSSNSYRYDGLNISDIPNFDNSIMNKSRNSYYRTLTINGYTIREELFGSQRCRVDPYLPLPSQAYSWRNSPMDNALYLFKKGLIDKKNSKNYKLLTSTSTSDNDNENLIKCEIPIIYIELEKNIKLLNELTLLNDNDWININKNQFNNLNLNYHNFKNDNKFNDIDVNHITYNNLKFIKIDLLLKSEQYKKYSYIDTKVKPNLINIINIVSNPQSRQIWDTNINGTNLKNNKNNSNWNKLKSFTFNSNSNYNINDNVLTSKNINLNWIDPQTYSYNMESDLWDFSNQNQNQNQNEININNNNSNNVDNDININSIKSNSSDSSWSSDNSSIKKEDILESPIFNNDNLKSSPINITTFTSWNNQIDNNCIYAIDIIKDDNNNYKLLGIWITKQINSDIIQLTRIQLLPFNFNINNCNFALQKLIQMIFDIKYYLKLSNFSTIIPYISIPSDIPVDDRDIISNNSLSNSNSNNNSNPKFNTINDMMYGNVMKVERISPSPNFTSWSLMYPKGISEFLGNIQQLNILSSNWDTTQKVFNLAIEGNNGTLSIILPNYPLDVIRNKGKIINIKEPDIIISQLDYFNVCCDNCKIISIKPKLRLDVTSFSCSLLYVNIIDNNDKKLVDLDDNNNITITLHIPSSNFNQNENENENEDNDKDKDNNKALYDINKLYNHGLKKRFGIRIEYLGIIIEHLNLDTNIIHTHEYLRNNFEFESENDPCCVFWPFE